MNMGVENNTKSVADASKEAPFPKISNFAVNKDRKSNKDYKEYVEKKRNTRLC